MEIVSDGGNTFRDNAASDNGEYGIDTSGLSNTFENTTATDNTAGAVVTRALDTRFNTLHINNSTTISLRGQNIVVGALNDTVDDPPNGTTVGRYVNLTPSDDESTWEDSWAFLNVSYDDSELKGSNTNESDLRLFRRGSLFVPLAPAQSADNGLWHEVTGEAGVNTEENYVYANVTPLVSPDLDQLPNETTPLSPNESLTGILGGGEERWYTMNATVGDRLEVMLRGEGENYYFLSTPTLRLYGPTGEFRALGEGNFDVRGDDGEYHSVGNETIGATVQKNGTHYLRFSDPSEVAANYSIERVLRENPNEPDDTRATATQIETGQQVNSTLGIDDVDWYAFEAEKGEAILPTLSLIGPIEDRAVEFGIIGPNGTDIRAFPNDAIHGNDYVTGEEWPSQGRQASGGATAEVNGTYYVVVFEAEENTATGPGTYNLTVETRKLDPFDPNQNRETATSIETGDRINGTASAYDEDWFTFEADAGERITVEVGTLADYPLAASVYDPQGELLAEREYIFLSWSWNGTADQTGQYYVQFHQSSDNWNLLEQWEYNLTVQTTDGEGIVDIDEDGLTDGEEVNVHGTDPALTDTDGDGWSDLSEINRACDPLNSLSHP